MRAELQQQIENSPFPFLLATLDMTVLWANDAAKKVLPAAALPDGLKLLLPGSDLSDCADHLRKGTSLLLSDPLLPGFMLKVVPFRGEREDIALVHLVNAADPQLPPMGHDSTQAIAAFSHSYRNPLADAFGMLGIIGSRLHAAMDDSCDTYLENISQDCFQMLRSFSNLTELYKIHSGGTLPSAAQPVDIWQLTRSLCESAALLLKAKDIALTCELPEAPCPVLCDQNRYATAFSNLLANSCRFTREGNAIHVAGKTSGDKAIVTIADRGLGIPEQYLGRVTEPFFSYDPDGGPFAGLGIGLPLVNGFARAAGGSLALQSREMEGTIVALSLPVYDGDLPPAHCRDAAQLLEDRFSPLQVVLGTVCKQ